MKKNLFTITLKWGVILGVALSLILFLRTFVDLEYLTINPILNMMQFVAFIAVLLLGMKEYRDKLLDGNITFPKALLSGILMIVFAFLLVIVYLTMQYSYMDNEIVTFYSFITMLAFGLLFAILVALYIYGEKK